MNNCLNIKKIWSDEHTIELKITASNPSVTSSIQIYLSEHEIITFIDNLNEFYYYLKPFEWIISDKTIKTSNYFYFRSYIYNNKKHVAFEIEMIDKDKFGHKVSMHIRSELEAINNFIE
jgi:hypothetical protein